MNIKLSTFIFTMLQGVLGVLAGGLAEKYPQPAFWCGIGVAVSGTVLMSIKQFFIEPGKP